MARSMVNVVVMIQREVTRISGRERQGFIVIEEEKILKRADVIDAHRVFVLHKVPAKG